MGGSILFNNQKHNIMYEIGKSYMVNTYTTIFGRVIPLVGKPHSDPDLGANFEHYHIDWRFVDDNLLGVLMMEHRYTFGDDVENYPYIVINNDERVKIEKKEMIYLHPNQPIVRFATWANKLQSMYSGQQCKGKKCPHRGADLSDCVPDKEGNIFCPYHALKIKDFVVL